MPNRPCWPAPLLGLTLLAGSCLAEAPEPKFFKLDFVVKELEASKVLNTRAYSMTVSTNNNSSMRTGSRVPTGVNFIEVGVNFDCRAMREVDNELALVLTAEVSSTMLPQDAAATATPIVRQNKWSSNVLVPLKKPTVVFSSDDVTSKHQLQLELTATPIK